MEVLTDRGIVGAMLPAGTVTLLLGDLEGSVRLWERDPEAMAQAVVRLDELITKGATDHEGARPVEQGEGDSFVLAFTRASDAVACALDLQRMTAREPWPGGLDLRFRMAIHTGEVELRDEGNYAGPAVNRCARLRNLAHGGQVLMSQAAREVVADRLPDQADLRELGSHVLRDMSRPELVHQLTHPDLRDDFPAIGGRHATSHNLPIQISSFVGRTREKAAITSLLDDTRVLTLTGAGGSGKTRLALELASEVNDGYPDGVWWIDLAALGAPDLVAAAIATAVDVHEQPGRDLSETLVESLRDRKLLLLLDNCEHLIGASAAIVTTLAHECPDVAVVATSREPLGMEGETCFRVPSLTVPDASTASSAEAVEAEAVRLFVERALKVRPNFRLDDDNAAAITAICRRLDGIPLAIELAAARIRLLTPAQIADRLSDRFRLLTGGPGTALPRQRTLEASVEWSFDLLSEVERLVLARLSVFAGTFSLDGAEAVCADEDLESHEVLDVLAALVDRSLVQVEETTGEARYRLLETIRVYARQKLAELDEPARVRDQHLEFYVDLAEQARVGLAIDFEATLVALSQELDNFRSSMDWAMATGRPLAVVDIAEPIFLFWIVRGQFTEMHRRLRDATACEDLEPLDRARGLVSASLLALMGGDYVAGFEFGDAAVDLREEHDDDGVAALAFAYRAWAGFLSGKASDDQVWVDLERAMELAQTLDDPAILARVMMFTGNIEAWGRSLPLGRARLEETLEFVAAHEVPYLDVPLHTFLALHSIFDGSTDSARHHGEEALRLGRPIGYHAFVSMALSHLGMLDAAHGAIERSAERFEESRRVARGAGLHAFELSAIVWGALVQYLHGDERSVLETAETAVRAAGAYTNAMTLAWCEWFLGSAALRNGDRVTAREYLEAARDRAQNPRFPATFGRSVQYLAWLAEAEGDVDGAWDLAHEALDVLGEYGDRLATASILETIAGLATATGGADRAARLLGAAERIHQEIEIVRAPLEADRQREALAATREALGDEAFDRCWAEGVAMAEEEAVRYARRGRGERGRPPAGWDSLTPAELDVIRRVVEGRSNAEIAQLLFVSPHTVKTHLSHVYTKLGISGRAELAAEATRRELSA